MEAGKVSWSDYNELFSYAYGGLKGIGVIVAIHVVINICTLGVSLFLAFSLTKRFSDDDSLGASERQSRDRRYNVVLTSLILFALISSFIGKFFSNRIFMGINRSLHDRITRRVLNTNIVFFEENT